MKIVLFVEQEDIRGRTARDQPVLAAGDSLGREMLERSSQVPRNTLVLPHSLTGWGRTRRAVRARRGELGLEQGGLWVACSTGWWSCRSWTQQWGAMAGRYMCPSPERYKNLQGPLLWGVWSLQWWRATGVGNGILEMPSLELGWGFSIHPNVMSPREAFLKGLSTTGHLLLGWGKPKAAHAKIWFSFFPSWDCFKIFLKAYCTKPLKIKYNPCANQRKPYHIMQMPKNACSAMHTGRGVMSLVPIRQFL